MKTLSESLHAALLEAEVPEWIRRTAKLIPGATIKPENYYSGNNNANKQGHDDPDTAKICKLFSKILLIRSAEVSSGRIEIVTPKLVHVTYEFLFGSRITFNVRTSYAQRIQTQLLDELPHDSFESIKVLGGHEINIALPKSRKAKAAQEILEYISTNGLIS